MPASLRLPLTRFTAALAVCFTLILVTTGASQAPARDDGLGAFLEELRAAVAAGSRPQLDALLSAHLPADSAGRLAVELIDPATTRVVVRDRDRLVLPDAPLGTGFRVVIEVFTERGDQARLATYRVDLLRAAPAGAPWRIIAAERLTSVDGLYRLRLDRAVQYAVTGLQVTDEDVALRLPRGIAFVARTPSGITAIVLIGDGVMRFSPRPAAEKVQVRLFNGREPMESPFTAAYLRVNPSDFDSFFDAKALAADRTVDPRALARANELFAAQVSRSFSLDLSDVSPDTWSLVPSVGDIVADVRTRKQGTLTYARANNEAEDVTLFDREARRNIALYSSVRRTEIRGGAAVNEDSLADYDIVDYAVEASYMPEREWMDGRVRMRLRVRSYALATLTLRLDEALAVRSVQSDRHGSLLSVRVRNQNSVLVSLPEALARDDLLTLAVVYGGRLPSVEPDREVIQASGRPQSFASSDMPLLAPEPRWVFSNRYHWYPQGTVTDYATGTLRITVPSAFEVVASGDASRLNPIVVPGAAAGDPALRAFEFSVTQPVRYFACVITRLQPAGQGEVVLRDSPMTPPSTAAAPAPDLAGRPGLRVIPPPALPQSGVVYRALDVRVLANPRQVSRGRGLLAQVVDILGFYGSVLDDLPYPSFTLTLLDNDIPGGHSPAYFALLHQPLPSTPFSWRNDPVHFDDYPQFYLAHELGHQFWGQAVGWKSYHEQWVSEGFSQYFALLYAEARGGGDVARAVVSRMRSTALAQAAQGPIDLGYRLGHVKDDSRVFRSLVYNKSALVLHMLRRLLGDEAFFAGLRRLYRESRFMKAGTDEVRAAFEATSGRDLRRYFTRWIREFAVPEVRYTATVEGDALRLVLEQNPDAIHDFPVTVTVEYANGLREPVSVAVTGARTEVRLPLRGAFRNVEVNGDNATLARFTKK